MDALSTCDGCEEPVCSPALQQSRAERTRLRPSSRLHQLLFSFHMQFLFPQPQELKP